MPVSLTVSNDSVDEMIADLKRIFPSLIAGTPLPPMQEQPAREEPAPPKALDGEVIEPPKKTRGKKADAPTIENDAKQVDLETAIAEKAADEVKAEIPDIADVRAKLMSLSAADGLGHDAVFELLGKFNAKNASTVPEEKRAELIAAIDALLAGAK